MSTSRIYLAKRLRAIGRHDLVEAAERGEVTLHSAALWCGLISQQHVPQGNGSQNASKRAAWALMRAERRGSLPEPKPEPAPEKRPAPLAPKFSQDSRAIIERLVSLGRADLVIAITERRISPFAAARIAARAPARETRHAVTENVTKNVTKNVTETSPRTVKPEPAQKPEKTKPAAPRLDVKALIG
jgi:hypothetical protein